MKPDRLVFALVQTLSLLFHLVQFFKCWQIFLESNSVSKFRKKSRSPQNVKLGIFHVVVVQ